MILVLLTLAAVANGLPDCPADYKDMGGCNDWEALGFCSPSSVYNAFMESNCKAACGLCKAAPPPPPQIVDVDINACLDAHNAKRRLHGVPGLTWDAALAAGAADWALILARNGTFEHSYGNYGENLYSMYGSKEGTCEQGVKSWYNEIYFYDYNNPGFHSSTGHFTQVVWKSTTKLGVGKATATVDGYTRTVVVARYTPAGNVRGQFQENVLPLQHLHY
ncbi:protein PRY1 [Exaiptasia diaphana]|uniref:ShKT domain-containing protein n=1 Tax=Exaiptasia diaphana TaxID=2652724 RepID=A0A913Y913_EXADI|nr:protein PRY1 [Exaiptasia diaphana]KXJ21233.1 Protein PRY1 [Exaiptasia diaphana]